MEENKNIKKARDELEQVSGNARLRRIAELKEKYIRDEQSSIEYAQDEGFKLGEAKGRTEGETKGKAIGRAEGKKEQKIEIAKNLLKQNVAIDIISNATSLSIAEIEALK